MKFSFLTTQIIITCIIVHDAINNWSKHIGNYVIMFSLNIRSERIQVFSFLHIFMIGDVVLYSNDKARLMSTFSMNALFMFNPVFDIYLTWKWWILFFCLIIIFKTYSKEVDDDTYSIYIAVELIRNISTFHMSLF